MAIRWKFSPDWELALVLIARTVPVYEPKLQFTYEMDTSPEPPGMPQFLPLHSERHPMTLILRLLGQSSILHSMGHPSPKHLQLGFGLKNY